MNMLQTDRELLEAAARAAGYQGVSNQLGAKHWHDWNPLTDDGDALRLAVKLGIHLAPELPPKVTRGFTEAMWDDLCMYEPHDGEPYAATRRAITRAAAALAPAAQTAPAHQEDGNG